MTWQLDISAAAGNFRVGLTVITTSPYGTVDNVRGRISKGVGLLKNSA